MVVLGPRESGWDWLGPRDPSLAGLGRRQSEQQVVLAKSGLEGQEFLTALDPRSDLVSEP